MADSIIVNQKSAVGSDTTQIATQNNYYGITPAEASQMAVDLFMDNFPKLQEEAMKTVRERIDNIIQEIVSQIDAKYDGNYSAFSKPDMQYILVEAEKGYARKGTPELCAILGALVADRSACAENSYLEIVLDKAIEVVPSLLPFHLDYLSLIFLYKCVCFGDISTLEQLKNRYSEIHDLFNVPDARNTIPFLNMHGLLTISLGAADEVLSEMYGFNKQDIARVLPPEYKNIHSDYSLTPVGIVLAIFNTHTKWTRRFELSKWIK